MLGSGCSALDGVNPNLNKKKQKKTHIDGCPFRFAYKSGFNSSAKVLASAMKIIYHQLLFNNGYYII